MLCILYNSGISLNVDYKEVNVVLALTKALKTACECGVKFDRRNHDGKGRKAQH